MTAVRIGDVIYVPEIDGARFCMRCGTPTHAPDGPHLCKDVARLEREAISEEWANYAREIVVLGGEA